MSPFKATAYPLFSFMVLTTLLAPSKSLLNPTMTLAPSFPSSIAMASPIPFDAPVIYATFPDSLFICPPNT